MGHIHRAGTAHGHAKARLADHHPGHDPHPVANQGVADGGVGADTPVAADGDAGTDHRARTDLGSAPDLGVGADDHATMQHRPVLDEGGGMDARLGGIEPAAAVKPRRRHGVGGLGLLGDQCKATRRERSGLGPGDEADPRPGLGKVGEVAAVGEETRGPGPGLGQGRDHVQSPSRIGALDQLCACKRSELARRGWPEAFVETRIRHQRL